MGPVANRAAPVRVLRLGRLADLGQWRSGKRPGVGARRAGAAKARGPALAPDPAAALRAAALIKYGSIRQRSKVCKVCIAPRTSGPRGLPRGVV